MDNNLFNIRQIDNDVVLSCPCFSLAQTLDCGQAFRFYEKDGIWQGVVQNIHLKMRENDDKSITFFNITKDYFMKNLYEYFTLDFDYISLQSILKQDEILKKAISLASGIRILKQDKWETVCSFIISQNNNIPRIKGIIGRLCENFGEKIDDSEEYTFPSAEKISQLSVEDLAPIRAGFRAKYIIDAARKIADGAIDFDILESAPLDDARNELMKIKGVGPKVAECVLLFSCARFDAFPLDVWMKRVMDTLYKDGLPDFAKRYKGIAQQYLFNYARTIKL